MTIAAFNVNVGYTLPTSHTVHRYLVAAAEAIRLATGGALALTLYPDERFADDIGMLDQLFAGTLDIMVVTGPFLGRRVPVAALPSLPFAFDDIAAVWRAVSGPLGEYMRAHMSAAGVHAFPHAFDNGFRHLTTTDRLVRKAGDVRGLKMRVVAAPLYQSLWESLGARTVSLDISQVRQAIVEGRVEAQDNPLPVVEAFALHQVQRRCALTAHVWDGYWIVANSARWRLLPASMQEAVSSAFAQAAHDQRAFQAAQGVALRGRLQDAGLRFDEADRASFRDALRASGFYRRWQSAWGQTAWTALQDATGLNF